MKPSPVQLLQLTFRKVCVELDEKHCPSEPPNPLTSPFSFEELRSRRMLELASERRRLLKKAMSTSLTLSSSWITKFGMAKKGNASPPT